LFLGQREWHHEKKSFREIGDFVAHRQERTKGVASRIAQDIFTSLDVWSLVARHRKQSITDIERAAWANFRLASDEQLRAACQMNRGSVKQTLQAGLKKLNENAALTRRELKVVLYLGNRFIWKSAFTDDLLFEEFRLALLKNLILTPAEAERLINAKKFLTVYALSCMHVSSVIMDNGASGELLAGFSNKERRLEVKVQLELEFEKPFLAPICMFLSSLQPEGVCEPALLEPSSGPLPHVWRKPLEINPAGRLAFLS
jgi:hypothetical protein